MGARLARRLLAAFGWSVDVAWPPGPRCVIAVYPHTSNWDFAVGYLAKLAAGLPAWWIGKHTLFRWPVGGLLRRMGGIPVDRGAPGALVPELVRQFELRPRLFLALAPEGTRAYTDHWKSGFYRVAVAAKVPIGLAFIDWRSRVVGLTTYLTPTGDEEEDLARIRAVYAGHPGKHPESAGEIRFRRGG
jgi:1-acyl-sn-glycerol-3-phosphate acyltransferase